MPLSIPIARDLEPIHLQSSTRWSLTWHPPAQLPPGLPHGSAGVCLTPSGELVLIKIRGVGYWEFPGGRPEGGESWEETLRREVAEEACAKVLDAKLLGFCGTWNQSDDTVRIRSYWKAMVRLEVWNPMHEIEARIVIPPATAFSYLSKVHLPISARAMVEAGAVVACGATGIVAGRALLADDKPAEQAKPKDHVCAGKNGCKGQGACATKDNSCAGQNACKGKGGCASASMKHDCSGKNECKGQGGCSTKDHKCAGQNACKGQGGCAVPLKKKPAPAAPKAG